VGESGSEIADRATRATVEGSASESQKSPVRLAAAGLALAALAVVLWAGYGHRWPWTGINGHTATLWDWLNLLLLPVAFGLLPVLFSKDTRLRAGHRWGVSAGLMCFLVFVTAGYLVPWAWTGFPGNKLWNWLELLALPLAVTLVPLMDDIRLHWNSRDSVAAGTGLCVFAAIVVGGYVGDWKWTGFTGNTLWDWMHLLLLPLLLPTVIVPRLVPKVRSTLIVVEEKPAQAGPARPESAEPSRVESLDHVE